MAKRKAKRPVVSDEVKAWRASLKVGDLVKLDAIIDKLEPIARLDKYIGEAGLPNNRVKMYRVPYRCSHRGPSVGILSTEVMWPPGEDAYAEDFSFSLDKE